jgi:hypothetical protein
MDSRIRGNRYRLYEQKTKLQGAWTHPSFKPKAVNKQWLWHFSLLMQIPE